MTAILFAASAAAIYGTADYCGGSAARNTPALAVTVVSQAISIPLIVTLALVRGGTPHPADLAWGGVAGVTGFTGLVLLYRGLSRGAMTVVAPTTAVTAALVPLVAGVALEGLPSTPALVGACCAVLAIGLVSLSANGPHAAATPALLVWAIASGIAFGLFYIGLDRTAETAGLWPLVAARLSSVTVGTLAAVGSGVSLAPSIDSRRWIVATGLLDVTAAACYLFAAQHGALAIVAPIAALYPVSTVLLALVIDRERVRRLQVLGLGLAALALILVSRAG